jgi:hypothetical protein
MFLADKLHEQLPRGLQQRLTILVMPYFDWDTTTAVIFKTDNRSEDLEIDV